MMDTVGGRYDIAINTAVAGGDTANMKDNEGLQEEVEILG